MRVSDTLLVSLSPEQTALHWVSTQFEGVETIKTKTLIKLAVTALSYMGFLAVPSTPQWYTLRF